MPLIVLCILAGWIGLSLLLLGLYVAAARRDP
jgi:membrane protein YqaA with SNARE-associated domain